MHTNDHQIRDYSAELDRKYGAIGTKEREAFDEAAWNFYSGQVLLEARKNSKVTQEELAHRINSSKSYISRIERGLITPSVGVFYRIINALGLRVDITRPIA
jgi:ribosome-binding protein aMBF1 (putative translation factor)